MNTYKHKGSRNPMKRLIVQSYIITSLGILLWACASVFLYSKPEGLRLPLWTLWILIPLTLIILATKPKMEKWCDAQMSGDGLAKPNPIPNPTTSIVGSIMHGSFRQVIFISRSFLARIDDYTQMLADTKQESSSQFFDDSYNNLETIIFDLKPEDLTPEIRNKIRSLIKETEKMASVKFNS